MAGNIRSPCPEGPGSGCGRHHESFNFKSGSRAGEADVSGLVDYLPVPPGEPPLRSGRPAGSEYWPAGTHSTPALEPAYPRRQVAGTPASPRSVVRTSRPAFRPWPLTPPTRCLPSCRGCASTSCPSNCSSAHARPGSCPGSYHPAPGRTSSRKVHPRSTPLRA